MHNKSNQNQKSHLKENRKSKIVLRNQNQDSITNRHLNSFWTVKTSWDSKLFRNRQGSFYYLV